MIKIVSSLNKNFLLLRRKGLCYAFTLGILGFLLSFLFTWKYGLGMRQETIAYATCAQNLLLGKGFSCFFDISDEVYVLWPPFLPLFLAFLTKLTSAHTLGILRLLNATCFGLAVLLLTLIVREHIKNKQIAHFGSFMILFSKPLLFVSVSGWSESFFIVLLLISFYSFEKYIDRGRRANFYIAAIFVSLAAFTRYAGLSAIIAGILLVLSQRTPLKKRWRDTCLFGIIASLPLSAWLIRNELVTHTLTGPRAPSKISLFDNFYRLLDCASFWFLPSHFSSPIRISIFLLLISAIVYAFLRKKKKTLPEQRESLSQESWVWIIFALCYSAFILITRSLLELEPLTDRYLSPLYVPLAIIFLFLIDRGFGHRGPFMKKPFFRKTLFILGALYLFNVFYWQVYASVDILKTDGQKIMAPPKNSKLLACLRKMSSQKNTFYSNTPDILTVLTGIPMNWSPFRGFPMKIDLKKKGPEKNGGVFLVWRPRRIIEKFLFPNEIRKHFNLELVLETPDGEIYRISRYKKKE